MNDPNGPFFDAKHSMYHVFWQDHLALPREGKGTGSIWGHAVSRDLARWTMLPVALWNDQAWDNQALFTGSATIVSGRPVLMYPGMTPDYPGGNNLAIATPANDSDPLLRDWSKPSGPVANHTKYDPSSAWRTPYGEWRLQTLDGHVFSTQDAAFRSGFYRVDGYEIAGSGECSSMFPLPRCTPGAVCNASSAGGPTHVHKRSTYADATYRLRVDNMIVGTLTEAPPGRAGNWTQSLGRMQEVDRTFYYASKDFWDSSTNRRILHGWLEFGNGALSLPREVTWHPQLQQLVFSPVPELEKLRLHSLGSVRKATPLRPNASVSLGCADTVEVRAIFARPEKAARLGVFIGANSTSQGYWYFVDYKPPPSPTTAIYNITVGRTRLPVSPGRYKRLMPDVDLVGADFKTILSNGTDFKLCIAACDANATCLAWTFVPAGCPACSSTCLLKSAVPYLETSRALPGGASGVKFPEQCEDSLVSDQLALQPSDRTLELHVFVDLGIVEGFFNGGRVAMTTPTFPFGGGTCVGALAAADGVMLTEAEAFVVGNISIGEEELLRTAVKR
jgi:sucrose-6-phosphate hydrolase SacC (GH32 family)